MCNSSVYGSHDRELPAATQLHESNKEWQGVVVNSSGWFEVETLNPRPASHPPLLNTSLTHLDNAELVRL